jgi:hypothetical protein
MRGFKTDPKIPAALAEASGAGFELRVRGAGRVRKVGDDERR